MGYDSRVGSAGERRPGQPLYPARGAGWWKRLGARSRTDEGSRLSKPVIGVGPAVLPSRGGGGGLFRYQLIFLILALAVPSSSGCGQSLVPGESSSAPDTVVELSSGTSGTNHPSHLSKPYLIMISFDGFRHDYLERTDLPNFQRVAREGVRAENLIPVFPTKTYPNHYSIATGMYTEAHGIVENNFYDADFGTTFRMRDTITAEDGRWYGGEPIWVTAERQGMVAGVYRWVGSRAEINGIRPTFWTRQGAKVNSPVQVRKALEWLSLPPEERPHLILLYFSTVDGAGHRHGPDSPEVVRATQRVDRLLGQLLDGLEALPIRDEVNLILVSDHGMAGVDPERAEDLDDLVSLRGVRMVSSGPITTLWVGDSVRADRMHDQLNAGLKHARAYRRYEVPESFRFRGSDRSGDILVVAEPGHQVSRRSRRKGSGGAHGYDPAAMEMRGIFMARGPAFRPGIVVPAFENVHIYPLITEILGLRPNPEAAGRLEVLAPILSEYARGGSRR